jgi:hypothetical protein
MCAAVLSSIWLALKNAAPLAVSTPASSEQVASDPAQAPASNAPGADKQALAKAYGKLPMQFEPNVGQASSAARYVAHGRGYSLAISPDTAVLSLRNGKNAKPSGLAMNLVGANAAADLQGAQATDSRTNYLIGNDPAKWHTDVANFSQVRASSVYPGVDIVYYGNGEHLEYDFVVAPGASTDAIKLRFDGAVKISADKGSGDLMLKTSAGTLRQLKPVVYQNIDGERKEVAGSYRVSGNMVSFNLGTYDRSKELVIDPVLAYGSYLGGLTFDEGRAIAVDAQGNAYIVGTASSLDFPTTPGALKPELLPRTDAANNYLYDAFVTKVNAAGTALVYSTYFGGRNGNESGTGVAVDANGSVVIAGTTMSPDLPVVNAFQGTFGGTDDVFAAKLSPTGSSIIYSTYLGGNNTDLGGSVVLNSNTGDAVFAGTSSSPNFPTTPGSYKQRLCTTNASCSGIFYSGSYVVKLHGDGSAAYSTLFDASVADVTIDAGDNALIGGTAGTGFPATPGAFQTVSSGGVEGFLAKLNPSGNALLFGTFLGGGAQSDRVKGVAVDSAGNMYSAGQTQNTGFPTTPGAFDQTFNGGEDAFLTKFNPQGSALVFSTFFGGTAKDEPFSVAVAGDGTAFVAGQTTSGASFPLKNSLNGTNGQIFVTRFNAAGSALVYSTFLGLGGAYDVALDSAANAYVTGHTTSIIVTPNSFQPTKGENTAASSTKDAFVAKLAPSDEAVPVYSISGVVSDPTQFGDYAPITVTLTGTVSRQIILPYGNGSGNIPYSFGTLPAGGNYTVTVKKIGHLTSPENASFNNLNANQFADFAILDNAPPRGVVTSPAHDATYSSPATINITATASDPDGHAIAKVDFVAYSSVTGTINISTDTTAPYEASWTNVPPGTYGLYAIPTDELGRRGDSTPVVQVHVLDTTNPNVTLTEPGEGSSFEVGTYVPVKTIVSSSITLLEFYDQYGLIGRRFGGPWTIDWRPMESGSYTLYAKGFTDSGQSFTSNSVHVTINPINYRISGRVINSLNSDPIPDVTVRLAGTNNPIAATTVTDATGYYSFTDLGAIPDNGFTITPESSSYTFDPAQRTINYVGYVHWDSMTFMATPVTGITAALTSPTDSQQFTAPATVHFAANAASTRGNITKVEFMRRNSGGTLSVLATDTQAPYEADWSNVPVGDYFVLATVTDSSGGVAQTNTVRITVGSQPTTIRLQGEVHDPNGAAMLGIPVDLTGTVNGAPINQTSTSSIVGVGAYGFFNLPAGGNYTITPRVTGGMTFTPPSITINNATADTFDLNFVSSAPNQAPTVTINSPANGASYAMPASIPFNVTASDADGQVVHLTVTANSPTQAFTVGQSNNGIFNAPWQPIQPGQYTIYAQARDNGGLLTTTSIGITVTQPAPVAVSGRIVDRNSIGIDGVTLELRDYPEEANVIAVTTTDPSGNFTISNIDTFRNYVLRPSKESYTFSPQGRIFPNLNSNQTDADYTGTIQVQTADFDGNGTTDYAVYRPATGAWEIMQEAVRMKRQSQPFGRSQEGDVPVPGNYDGDLRIDAAIYRGGQWLIKNSSERVVRTFTLGGPGDIPMPADFDGDGKTDLAVWRPSDGTWTIRYSMTGVTSTRQWGITGDLPQASDFDGDGIADLAVWRRGEANFYITYSGSGATGVIQVGSAGNNGLVGDFDGDHKADPASYEPASGTWTIKLSSSGQMMTRQWGVGTDRVVPGDYDHDGKTDLAFFRASTREWFVYRSSTQSYTVTAFGRGGDVPIPSVFVR